MSDAVRSDWDRATEVADYVRMGPGSQDIRDRVHRLLAEARAEEREACIAIADRETEYWTSRAADGLFASENIARSMRNRIPPPRHGTPTEEK